MVPIIAVNIKVKEKGGLESAYNQVLSKEPEYTTWKVMTMTLAITILHKTMSEYIQNTDTLQLRGNAADPSTTVEKKDTIDFIFFDPKTLHCEAVLNLPKDLGEELLPSMIFPSDHMSLVARLSM